MADILADYREWRGVVSTWTDKCDICGAENAVPSYGDWDCEQCGQRYSYDECHRISLTAVQWALLRNPPRWIPVSERLPPEETRVLAYDGTSVFESEYMHGRWEWLADVTHWLPLPNPPEVT